MPRISFPGPGHAPDLHTSSNFLNSIHSFHSLSTSNLLHSSEGEKDQTKSETLNNRYPFFNHIPGLGICPRPSISRDLMISPFPSMRLMALRLDNPVRSGITFFSVCSHPGLLGRRFLRALLDLMA